MGFNVNFRCDRLLYAIKTTYQNIRSWKLSINHMICVFTGVSTWILMMKGDKSQSRSWYLSVVSVVLVVVCRSEEHTSELQSHSELVCRLLLEKKKVCQLYLDQLGHIQFNCSSLTSLFPCFLLPMAL